LDQTLVISALYSDHRAITKPASLLSAALTRFRFLTKRCHVVCIQCNTYQQHSHVETRGGAPTARQGPTVAHLPALELVLHGEAHPLPHLQRRRRRGGGARDVDVSVVVDGRRRRRRLRSVRLDANDGR